MTAQRPDFNGAFAAVSGVVVSMERRLTDVDRRAEAARQARQRGLDALTTSLLPGISGAVLKVLEREVPGFVRSPKISKAFAENRKRFGLFKRPHYDAVLAMLQAQLRAFLEQNGAVYEEDQAIARTATERTDLVRQLAEARELLRLIERAGKSGAAIPAAVTGGLNKLAARGRVPCPRPRHAETAAAYVAPDDDSDLWLWMLTDFPTSSRTLLLDAITASPHHDNMPLSGGGQFGGGGASGVFPMPDADGAHVVADVASDYSRDAGAGGLAMSGLAMSAGGDEESRIATDDRLGVFS